MAIAGLIVLILVLASAAAWSIRGAHAGLANYVEAVEAAEKAFELLDQHAVVLWLTGGPATCWVDVTSDGRTESVRMREPSFEGPNSAEQLEAYRSSYREEHFVFAAREPDEAGIERWGFTLQTGCCEPKPLDGTLFGFGLRLRLGANAQRSGTSRVSAGQKEIRVGRGVRELQRHLNVSGHIPSPLPMGQEVAIRTIEKRWMNFDGTVAHQHAYTILCRAGGP